MGLERRPRASGGAGKRKKVEFLFEDSPVVSALTLMKDAASLCLLSVSHTLAAGVFGHIYIFIYVCVRVCVSTLVGSSCWRWEGRRR